MMDDDFNLLDTSIDYFTEAKELCAGIFWVITDNSDLSNRRLLMFEIPCDSEGNHIGTHTIPLNAKNHNTYNHQRIWESEIKNNSQHRPYNKKAYDYYPRGRIEISNNRATIYLNPNINKLMIVSEIKLKFGLIKTNISEVRVIPDNSNHYQCWIDRE